MSTGSIKHNIEIANPADAERFVEALEEAERISEEGMERLNKHDISEIKKVFNSYNDETLSTLAVTLSKLGLDCIDTIEAQQQEIGDLKQNLKIQEAITMREMGKVTALTADKDEQAGRIMRMVEALEEATEDIGNMYGHDTPQTERYRSRLLGGKEE